MRIWLDDERPMPDSYDIHCVTAKEAIEYIRQGVVTKISLDCDLGDGNGSGYEVAKFIEESAYNGSIPVMNFTVHSQNPVESKKTKIALQNAKRYWMGRNQ